MISTGVATPSNIVPLLRETTIADPLGVRTFAILVLMDRINEPKTIPETV